MSCAHRITGGEESYCFLQSHRASEHDDSMMSLVFHGARPDWPALCDARMLSVCPFRASVRKDGGKGALVPCPFCHRRHRSGSTAKRICEDWHSVKSVLKEMRGRRPPVRYFEEGTTLLPYRSDTPGLVRQLIWPRLKAAILRRDRYTCQDCGADFGSTRRKVHDACARKGKGGYVWESLEVHHIVPRSRGGGDHPGNLKTLCPACHRSYTDELRLDAVDARRRESEILGRMKALDEDENDWEAPAD
jgi:5-methylcytosine-specific restriction protein A